MKNRKGFTLVELLAVIVILALIMSIAVISIGGVLQSTRQSTFKETAASIIDGVQKQLLIANELKDGYYHFTKNIIDKGGDESPLGGSIIYSNDGTQIGTSPVYRASGTLTCSDNNASYVHVKYDGTTYKYTYSICLTAGDGNYFITDEAVSTTDTTPKSEYTRLLNNSLVDMIKKD